MRWFREHWCPPGAHKSATMTFKIVRVSKRKVPHVARDKLETQECLAWLR